MPDGSFPLPPLSLKRSGGVLDEAIAVIRNDRAALHGQPGRVFNKEEMVRKSRESFKTKATVASLACSFGGTLF